MYDSQLSADYDYQRILRTLKRGDEIILKLDDPVLTYILEVYPDKIVTSSGHIVSRTNQTPFEATGNNKEVFEISDQAKAILTEIETDSYFDDNWFEDIALDPDPLDLL